MWEEATSNQIWHTDVSPNDSNHEEGDYEPNNLQGRMRKLW